MKIGQKTFLIDIGNSTLQYSIANKNNTFTIYSLETKNVDQTVVESLFKGSICIISSVVPEIESYFVVAKQTYFVNSDTDFLKVNLKHKHELGADRIATAIAAFETYGESIIIDSGTAITFCYVDQQGVYQGGCILPGLKIASQSLNDYTAKIPLIYVNPMASIHGKTTKESVQIGLYQGFKHSLKGLISDYKKQYPNATVIGTGSGLEIYRDEVELDVYDTQLIFKGLQFLLNKLTI